MFCPICGASNAEGAAFCVSCGAQLGQAANNAVQTQGTSQAGFQNDLAFLGQAMYEYCKVKMDPKTSKGGIIGFGIFGAVILILGIAAGVYQLAIIGAAVGLIGALVVWGAGKAAVKNAQRLQTLFDHDGEEFILREFGSAQTFAKDQFRMSGFYIFAKGKGVFRTVNVEKITRVTESTNFIPTGVRLDVNYSDESGPAGITLCRLHLGKSKNEAEELFNEIMARKQYAYEQYTAQNR